MDPRTATGLQHHAGARADVVATQLGDVLTVEQDAPSVELVEAHDEVDQGGLARSGGSDDGDGLPGSTRNDRSVMRGRSGVYEKRTFWNSMTPRPRSGRRVDGVGLLLVGVEEGEDAFRRGGPGLHDGRHSAQLRQRLRELLRVLDEGLHVAEADLPGPRP